MLRRGALAPILALVLSLAPADRLPIGSKAPMAEVALPTASGGTLTLREAAGAGGLLVIFSSNTCPWVRAWEDRYRTLAVTAAELGVGVLALNANEGDRGEALADMQARAYPFPYALDKGRRLAGAFGATRMPEVFLFDKTLTLVYTGAIDDNARQPGRVEAPYLVEALTAMAAGNPIARPETRVIGCAIKRSEE